MVLQVWCKPGEALPKANRDQLLFVLLLRYFYKTPQRLNVIQCKLCIEDIVQPYTRV